MTGRDSASIRDWIVERVTTVVDAAVVDVDQLWYFELRQAALAVEVEGGDDRAIGDAVVNKLQDLIEDHCDGVVRELLMEVLDLGDSVQKEMFGHHYKGE